MGKEQIIELNGKRYDARTGRVVSGTTKKAPLKKPTASANLDGFARPHRAAVPKAASAHRPVQKSKTLMRQHVHRPEVTKKPAHSARPTISHLATEVTPSRLARAQATTKSKLIQRFGAVSSDGDTPAAVTPAALVPAVSTTAPKPLDKALANATAHQQPRLKRPRLHHRVAKRFRVSPRFVSISAGVFALVVLGSFIAYQNMPNLAMRVAAARSGVHGTLPSYQPAGFSMHGGISYHVGQITIGYKSNSDQRIFTITQTASSWDSATLLDNYVVANHPSYQTIQNGGKTVYIYDSSNATWVDGGIWYRVEGSSHLNSDQLLHLVASM